MLGLLDVWCHAAAAVGAAWMDQLSHTDARPLRRRQREKVTPARPLHLASRSALEVPLSLAFRLSCEMEGVQAYRQE